MCKYCTMSEKHHSMKEVVHGSDMCETYGVIHIENVDSYYYIAFESAQNGDSGESYPIENCPMCGRKLGE